MGLVNGGGDGGASVEEMGTNATGLHGCGRVRLNISCLGILLCRVALG